MKPFKLVLVGILVGICFGSGAIFGIQQYRDRQEKWEKEPREYQLTQEQVGEITTAVNTYLHFVKERKWEQAYSMYAGRDYLQGQNRKNDLRAFQADWESFGTISKFKFSESSAMYYPANKDHLVITADYSIVCTSALPGVTRVGSIPIGFKVVQRAGQWKIISRHAAFGKLH